MTDGERRMTGRVVHDPVMAARAEARREYIHNSLYSFMEELPSGDNGIAPEAIPYTQPNATTCFYAALGGIASAIHNRHIELQRVGDQARQEGLLGPYGAETFPEFEERQTEFVRQHLGINVRFIPQHLDRERLDSLTADLVGGQPVVFGLPRHWVALDGIRKFERNRSSLATWKGMNPYPRGRRLESNRSNYLTPETVISRLIKPDMPIIVIEQSNSPRFVGRGVRTAKGPRFRPTEKQAKFRPSRRLKRAE